VTTETQHAATIGIKESISQINEGLGVAEPTVCFIVVHDHKLCKECKRTHLLADEITPRAWKESEIQTDYHEHGVDAPSWQLMHPHCRCHPATILPGFGFDASGRIAWVASGFSELEYQRGSDQERGLPARRKWFAAR
jgi:hypothetical protein